MRPHDITAVCHWPQLVMAVLHDITTTCCWPHGRMSLAVGHTTSTLPTQQFDITAAPHPNEQLPHTPAGDEPSWPLCVSPSARHFSWRQPQAPLLSQFLLPRANSFLTLTPAGGKLEQPQRPRPYFGRFPIGNCKLLRERLYRRWRDSQNDGRRTRGAPLARCL